MFLTAAEARQIRIDFNNNLNAAEASTITGYYSQFTNPTLDEVYSVKDYDAVDLYSITGKALQHIVKPLDIRILSWGILDAGDCIFYFNKNLELNLEELETMYFVDPGGNKWNPVVRNNRAFTEYIRSRLGNTQIAQSVPCKLRS